MNSHQRRNKRRKDLRPKPRPERLKRLQAKPIGATLDSRGQLAFAEPPEPAGESARDAAVRVLSGADWLRRLKEKH